MMPWRVPTLVLLLLFSPTVLFGDEPKPVDVGLEERVEVRMVLLDVLVVDRGGRTVPDLSREDLELLVDGKRVEIETLDRQCPAGAAEDARVAEKAGDTVSKIVAARAGRIILVFDYNHMISSDPRGNHHQGVAALRAAGDALKSGRLGANEYMVVSLGEVLRVESPLTSDRNEVLRTLDRMTRDPELFHGPRGLTEFRFFDRLMSLLDVLEAVPGRKAVVLFSGPLVPDGWTHDPVHARLASMSATSRTAIYPVDTGGLRTPEDPDAGPLGGPLELRRLADETGGRMTADTNDLALGPARAERDLSCTYTIGFHDLSPRLDRSRRVTVLLPEKRRLRAIYPTSYVVRSPAERARSLLETASIAPQSFESDALRAELILSGPRSPKRWDATLAVELCRDPGAPGSAGVERELRAFLRTPSGTTLHSFRRRIVRAATDAGGGSLSDRTILERISVRPGRYVLSAVMSSPEGGAPLATVREVEVPAIPHVAPVVVKGSDLVLPYALSAGARARASCAASSG